MTTTPEEKERRLEAARRAIAGFGGMLATAVATAEAMRRIGDTEQLAQLAEMFEYHAQALRLSTKIAEMELDRLQRTP